MHERFKHSNRLLPAMISEKEINEIMDNKMKKEIPNTATYALIQNMILPFGKNDMTFDEIIDKWPDAVMHYPVYMGLSFSNKDRLKDVSTPVVSIRCIILFSL